MANQTLTNAISQHYLEVQALTPVSSSTTTPVTTSTSQTLWQRVAPSTVIIFIIVLLIGMLALLITRSKNPNKLLIVVSLAFLTSILPLGLKTLNERTQLPSQADASYTPTHVIVDQVTPNSFNLSWQTSQPTTGTLNYREATDPKHLSQIVVETPNDAVYSHYIQLTNLQPNTTYLLEILSGGTWYGLDNQPLTITTR